MDKSQISEIKAIKAELIASNPDLQGQLSDEVVAKAVETVSEKNIIEQQGFQPSEPSAKLVTAPAEEIVGQTNGKPSEAAPIQAADTGEILAAVLESLHGNNNSFTRENPDLAKNVNNFLGL